MLTTTRRFKGKLLLGLKTARQSRNLTRAQLSEMSGVGYVFLWRLENGKNAASVPTLTALTAAMQCGEDELEGKLPA